jgi:uncharacterized membrane protein
MTSFHQGSGKERARTVLRWLAAVAFIVGGANHFRASAFYRRIVPPPFPNPPLLVAVSGVFEILGGLGLLVNRLRRMAGWGLIALLVAVFPANIHMAMRPEKFADLHLPNWAMWLRLPLQPVMMAWVWFVSRDVSTEALSGTPKTPGPPGHH